MCSFKVGKVIDVRRRKMRKYIVEIVIAVVLMLLGV